MRESHISGDGFGIWVYHGISPNSYLIEHDNQLKSLGKPIFRANNNLTGHCVDES